MKRWARASGAKATEGRKEGRVSFSHGALLLCRPQFEWLKNFLKSKSICLHPRHQTRTIERHYLFLNLFKHHYASHRPPLKGFISFFFARSYFIVLVRKLR
jgi:hypothetical protein